MWKIHINPKPEKPDILAAINRDGSGSGAASHSKPEQLVGPALTALLTRPRLSFWNAAACGLGDDGWEREAQQEALKPLFQCHPIFPPSSAVFPVVHDLIVRSRLF